MLNSMREKLSYYPENIWLYLLASQYDKISQQAAFVGRTGSVSMFMLTNVLFI